MACRREALGTTGPCRRIGPTIENDSGTVRLGEDSAESFEDWNSASLSPANPWPEGKKKTCRNQKKSLPLKRESLGRSKEGVKGADRAGGEVRQESENSQDLSYVQERSGGKNSECR